MNYKEYYYEFWIPILKKQYFKFRLTNDKRAISSLENNVLKNWYFDKNEKKEILKKIKGAKTFIKEAGK